jgi:Protein kinase domain
VSASEPAGEPTLPFVDDDAAGFVPVKIGRYQLLELVGAGGMGMVWASWDPELERRVALKLVRSASPEGRARMLREGQVLARLSHPNIVPIFDVGEIGDQVYLVMEWVRGKTLRAYHGEAREPRALLEAYRQAGEGLAAAHEAGVVHRDFKPDNAVRGDDGRVRVLDFGIAHDEAKPAAAPNAGTPKYMAPEHPATAASDQYAFCLSLREALEVIGGGPSWVAAIVARGSDPDLARRFESMRELLRALSHDPARRWRRAAIGAVAIGAAVAAFAIGSSRSSSAPTVEPCSGAASEIAADWNPSLRDKMLAHLRGLGAIGATEAEPLGKDLDAYATTWIDEHRRACLAQERKELPPSLYEERLGCLTRLRSQLAATGELMAGVDAGGLAPALVAAHGLPDPRGCRDTSGLVAPPPAAVADRVRAVVPEIERARVRAAAQRGDALELAKTATAAARATGYQPLIARALLVEGRAATVTQPDARATFAEAMNLALAASDDATAVEAYARWIFELGRNDDTKIDNWPVMSVVAARNGKTGRFARALMYSNRAEAMIAADDKPDARLLLVQAQAIAGDRPELELVAIDKNLASLESDSAACTRRLRVALDRLQAALGPSHPDVLLTRIPIAMLDRDRTAARAQVDDVCRGLERWGHTGSSLDCAYEAAWLAHEAGDRSTATAWMSRIVAGTSDPNKLALAKAYVALSADRPDRAAVAASLTPIISGAHAAWWTRLDAADALALLAEGDPALWRRAVAMIETVDQPYYARRVARSRARLAEYLAGTSPNDARHYAELALAWYRDAPGDEALATRLQAITKATR